MAGWHHRCNEHELGQTPGDGEGQGGLACCSPQGRKESDTTEATNILTCAQYKSSCWGQEPKRPRLYSNERRQKSQILASETVVSSMEEYRAWKEGVVFGTEVAILNRMVREG